MDETRQWNEHCSTTRSQHGSLLQDSDVITGVPRYTLARGSNVIFYLALTFFLYVWYGVGLSFMRLDTIVLGLRL